MMSSPPDPSAAQGQVAAGAARTERRDPRFDRVDEWDTPGVLSALWEGQLAAAAAVGPALAATAQAVEEVATRLAAGGRLAYAGAGTSGRLAVQDGIELVPTFGWSPVRLVYLLAGGDAALTRAVEGAEDDEGAAETAVAAAGLGPEDCLLALAASGGTPFTRAAARAARTRGTLVVAVANNPAVSLLAECDHPILLDTGAEAIAGSTRMKAGTAQRIWLTLFSTSVMVRLGRVYGSAMVDLVATNAKLQIRAVRMVEDIAGVDHASAAAALARTNGRVKPAILVARGWTEAAAAQALSATGGRLRPLLGAGVPAGTGDLSAVSSG